MPSQIYSIGIGRASLTAYLTKHLRIVTTGFKKKNPGIKFRDPIDALKIVNEANLWETIWFLSPR